MTSHAVVKLGGNAALDCAADRGAAWRATRRSASSTAAAPQISALARERGVEPHFVGGRRVTDEPMLACVRAGLARVAAELCAALERRPGSTPCARRRRRRRAPRARASASSASRVGARADAIVAALASGRVPVVAPLGRDADGTILNVNADDAAAAIATALAADELVFLSDVPGRARRAGRRAPADLGLAAAGERERGHAAEARGLRRGARSAACARVSIGVAGTVVTP